MKMKIFRVSQKNPLLSIAEISAWFPIVRTEGEFVFVKAAKKYDFFAYIKEVYTFLFETSLHRLAKAVETFNWNAHIKGSFCIRSPEFEKEIADVVWHRLKNPKVNLENPEHSIHFLFAGKKAYCGILQWQNPNTFLQRKAHLRPELYPASLDPQLALAMINLSKGRKIVDPFCGTGGILIEGAFSGRKMYGYDISRWMVEKCKKNLAFYKLNVPAAVGDATTFRKKCNAIVTELPFGRNTKSQDLDALYRKFLENAKNSTNKIVVSFPDFVDYPRIIAHAGWIIEHDFAVYVHASLTKHVVVMGKM